MFFLYVYAYELYMFPPQWTNERAKDRTIFWQNTNQKHTHVHVHVHVHVLSASFLAKQTIFVCVNSSVHIVYICLMCACTQIRGVCFRGKRILNGFVSEGKEKIFANFYAECPKSKSVHDNFFFLATHTVSDEFMRHTHTHIDNIHFSR